MGLVGARPIYRPPVAGEPLRLRDDEHWSTQGLVLYLPMREGVGGMTQDLSRFGNDGTLVNGPTWRASERGAAVRFDGVNDCIPLTTYIVSAPSALTVFARVRWGGGVNSHLIGAYKASSPYVGWGFGIDVGTSSAKRISLWSDPISTWIWSTSPMPINTWVTVAVSCADDVARFYLDGVANGFGEWTRPSACAIPAVIGARADLTQPFNGMVETLQVHDRALSAAELLALHANPDLPLWRPRRGISLALVGVGSGAVPTIYRAARRRSRTLIPGMVVLP